MQNTVVISLGGSIISPGEVDIPFLRGFHGVITEYLEREKQRRIVIVTGGGAPARLYQGAYKQLSSKPKDDLLDCIGIAATRLNGELIRALFNPLCRDPLVTDLEGKFDFTGSVLIGSGWKPGFSSDYDAVFLASRYQADKVINLSNIPKVYTADPKEDPLAAPIDRINWKGFRGIVGDTWIPGKNVPFDPIAAQFAEKLGLKVIIASGRDLENLEKILEDRAFSGTIIHP